MNRQATGNEISIEALLEREGRTLEAIMRGSLFGDENTPALCEEGCEVEADGICEHGCRSILLAAELI